jgi:hypothetical protein
LFDLEVQSKSVPDEFARRGVKTRPQTLLDKGGEFLSQRSGRDGLLAPADRI